jgi:cell division control protein 11
LRLQREIEEKRQELLVREAQLREMEARIERETAAVAGEQLREVSAAENSANKAQE